MAQELSHQVTLRRHALGWTQSRLAEESGLPRSTVGAIEGRRLTPSVTAALALAAALGCTVEELFGEAGAGTPGSAWAWPEAGQGRYWEAEVGGQRWLYPATADQACPHDGTAAGGVLHDRPDAATPPTLVLAGCDPAVELLAAEYAAATGFRLLAFSRGGAAALDLLKRGVVHVAAVHRSTAEQPDRNAAAVRQAAGSSYRLLRYAEWEEGIALTNGSRSASIQSLARRCDRWALREPGSAARECLDEILGGREAQGCVSRGHRAVAEAVQSGWAAAGVCVRLTAEESGLPFLPVRTESLDFCIAEQHISDPRVQGLIRLVRSRSFRRLLSDLPGYDARHSGELSKI